MATEEKMKFCGIHCNYRLSAIFVGLIESFTLLIYLSCTIFLYVESRMVANCVDTNGDVQLIRKCNDYQIYRYLSTHPVICLSISCTVCSIWLGCIAAMFLGLYKIRPRLLLPHLSAQALAVVILVSAIVLYSIRAASVGIEESVRAKAESVAELDVHHTDPILKEAMAVDVSLVVLLVIVWIMNIYFFVIIYKCYRYLKDILLTDRMNAINRDQSISQSHCDRH